MKSNQSTRVYLYLLFKPLRNASWNAFSGRRTLPARSRCDLLSWRMKNVEEKMKIGFEAQVKELNPKLESADAKVHDLEE